MDEDGLPIVGSGVDLTKVPAIQQRRVVAYLNQFVVHTVRFLNRFSTVCEEKLANISLRIQQIETTLCILEAKLSSIPGLEDVTVDGLSQQKPAQANGPTITNQSQEGPPAEPLPPAEPAQAAPEAASDTESRSSCRERHDSGQRPTLRPIPENGSSGSSGYGYQEQNGLGGFGSELARHAGRPRA
ncbi:WASH complex subunit 3 [Larimichthys crocea]|uniref:Uncharacterized protein n=1 Tax=Larimichthys crocea TaxID=215358 RepID=A0ACD3Q6Z2_LARCR|nr:WASH complex subunit 3 [Larimichthys crocea]